MVAIVIGTLFLILGLAIRVYPNILAGYGSLSQSERDNAEKNGLRFYGFLLFMLVGAVAILGYPISIWLERPSLATAIAMVATMVGMVVAVVGGNFLVNNRVRSKQYHR